MIGEVDCKRVLLDSRLHMHEGGLDNLADGLFFVFFEVLFDAEDLGDGINYLVFFYFVDGTEFLKAEFYYNVLFNVHDSAVEELVKSTELKQVGVSEEESRLHHVKFVQ